MSDFQKDGYIKLMRQAQELLENDPDAYLLMSQIMFRARWRDSRFNRTQLLPNQCYIGDYKKIGLTEQRYRDVKYRIEHIYRLATFQGTNKGTIATITNLEFCDINYKPENEQKNETRTDEERTKNEQRTTNEERKKERREEGKEEQDIARSTSSPRKKEDEISFSFDERKFLNISYEDMSSWADLYPSIDVSSELKRMVEWCLSNQSKAKSKKLWRKFIYNWLERANEKAINRLASKEAKINTPKESVVNKDKRSNPKFFAFAGEA